MKYIFIFMIVSATIFISAFRVADSEKPISETELGKKLFFDPILSSDKTISCASCHKPEFAFADTMAFSKGVGGQLTARNTPSAMNVAGRPYLFWDGRVATLEEQVLHPIANPVEMGIGIHDVIKRLQKNTFYKKAFKQVYGKKPSALLLGKAIASFERTLETGGAPIDLFIGGDSSAISISAMRGRDLFLDKAHCFDCHFTPDFTADEFRNIGLFNGFDLRDSGRYNITHKTEDIGKFKVPGLRNVALTAPYMHNGMFRTLEEVVEYYNNPDAFVPAAIGRDGILSEPLLLSAQEKQDLVEFLKTLTSLKLVPQ
ncbi:MAG: c-type cytochrome [Bacteroidetes bacterium]|nr:c-type cytochrome [Bacteroidota bacterium]